MGNTWKFIVIYEHGEALIMELLWSLWFVGLFIYVVILANVCA
jgi:hypothetical protein